MYRTSLGELSGNNFSIVVRGAKVPGRAVESSLQGACLGGFVNFFGTQRVGSPSAAARGQPLPYQVSSAWCVASHPLSEIFQDAYDTRIEYRLR